MADYFDWNNSSYATITTANDANSNVFWLSMKWIANVSRTPSPPALVTYAFFGQSTPTWNHHMDGNADTNTWSVWPSVCVLLPTPTPFMCADFCFIHRTIVFFSLKPCRKRNADSHAHTQHSHISHTYNAEPHWKLNEWTFPYTETVRRTLAYGWLRNTPNE